MTAYIAKITALKNNNAYYILLAGFIYFLVLGRLNVNLPINNIKI
jgi:hypothetical protein